MPQSTAAALLAAVLGAGLSAHGTMAMSLASVDDTRRQMAEEHRRAVQEDTAASCDAPIPLLLLTSSGVTSAEIKAGWDAQYEKAKAATGKTKVVFIPDAAIFDQQASAEQRVVLSVAAATYVAGQLGLPPSELAVAEAASVPEGVADSLLDEAAAVYIEMGASYYLAYHLRKSKLDGAIERLVARGGLFAGASSAAVLAGASLKTYEWKTRDRPEAAPYGPELRGIDGELRGLGLVAGGASVFPQSGPDWEETVTKMKTKHTEAVVVIDEGHFYLQDSSGGRLVDAPGAAAAAAAAPGGAAPAVTTTAAPAVGNPADPDEAHFAKLDVRVGKIVEAWEHPESDKLWCQKIDVGEEEPRQILSGIRKYYATAEDLVGKSVLVVCNLKASKLGGIASDGMVLCGASADRSSVVFIEPPEESPPGERVTIENIPNQEPASGNQIKKKKLLEKACADLRIVDHTATYRFEAIRTEAGLCKAPSLDYGTISQVFIEDGTDPWGGVAIAEPQLGGGSDVIA